MPCTTTPRGTPDGMKKNIQTPDCAASKSTIVTTPEGEKLRANFNMGTGEVTYDEVPAADSREEDAPENDANAVKNTGDEQGRSTENQSG